MQDASLEKEQATVALDEWLDDKMAERDDLMRKLRRLERILISHKRIKAESLPRKAR